MSNPLDDFKIINIATRLTVVMCLVRNIIKRFNLYMDNIKLNLSDKNNITKYK